ncbi:MAG: hypothetical protein ACTMHH_06125 [Nesterenkonia sp.]
MDQRRPHSPATYRRRRLVVALLAVFVLALVVWGARGLIDAFSDDEEPSTAAEEAVQTQNDDASGPEATAEADSAETQPAEDDAESAASDSAESDAAESEPAETPSAAQEQSTGEATEEPDGSCAAGDVAVRASTNQAEYDAGMAPLLILEVENTGNQACTLDVGTAEQTFAVAHAGREMFNTAQCGTEGDSLEMEFEPGQTERAHLVWPRSDSGVDCSEPSDVATGDYELTVSVSGITSDPHTFHVTGAPE